MKYNENNLVVTSTITQLEDKLNNLPMATKNKLYVACTRTKNNLFFISEDKIKDYKCKE